LKPILFENHLLILYIYSSHNPKQNGKPRSIILAVALIIGVGNYSRIADNENITTVQFLSIFAIGAISSLLLKEIIARFNKKR
jgi:xanthine/uracil permease